MAGKWHLFLARIQSILRGVRRVLGRSPRRFRVYPLLFLLVLLLSSALPLAAQVGPAAPSVAPTPAPGGRALLEQGRQKYEAGQWDAAAALLQRALMEFQQSGQGLEQAIALSNLSLVYQAQGQWQNAQTSVETALTLLRSGTEQPRFLAHALEILAQLQLSLGQAEQALHTWQEAALQFGRAGDRPGQMRSQVHRSLAWQALGFYRQALKTLVLADPAIAPAPAPLQWWAAQPASPTQALAFRSLGNLLRVVGVGAIETAADQDWLQWLDAAPGEAATGYLQASERALRKSLAIAQQVGDPEAIAAAHLGLGNTSSARYSRARDAFSRVPLDTSLREGLTALSQSLTHFRAAAAAAPTRLTGLQAEFNTLSLLLDGNAWLRQNRDTFAGFVDPDSLRQQSAELSQALERQLNQLPNQLDHLNRLPVQRTTIYAKINAAQNLLRYAFAIPGTDSPHTTPDRAAWIAIITQELNQSIQQAQTLQDTRAESYALGYLARLYEKQAEQAIASPTRWQPAQTLTEKALLLAETAQSADLAYQWQWQLGRILKQRDRLPGAIAAYKEAVQHLNRIRQDLNSVNNPDIPFSFRDDVEPVYRELVDLLLQVTSTHSSQTTATEFAHGAIDQSWNEFLIENRAPFGSQPKTHLTNQKSQFANRKQNSFQEQRVQNQNTNDPQERERQENSAILLGNLKQARQFMQDLRVLELENFLGCRLQTLTTIPIDEVNEEDPEAAILYPIVLDERLELLIKLPGQELRKLAPIRVSKTQLETTAQQFRQNIALGEQSREEGQSLYNWLIRPIEPLLQATPIKTLVFVLDGELRNIPLAALYDSLRQEFLLQKPYAIALNLGTQPGGDRPLRPGQFKALVAGVDAPFENFDRLPGLAEHLQTVARTLPGSTVLNSFTAQTLKSAVNAQPFSIIHLATHGIFSSSPEKTFLVAAGERMDLNQIREVLYSRIENRPDILELLVLAACQTAVGDRRAVLGIAGIAAQTGARSTLATLVSVRTDLKFALLESFYRHLLETPNRTKAEALHQAQLETFNQDRTTPAFWAPYILVGNWR